MPVYVIWSTQFPEVNRIALSHADCVTWVRETTVFHGLHTLWQEFDTLEQAETFSKRLTSKAAKAAQEACGGFMNS